MTAAVMHATGDETVHVGRDGWLFLVGGSNDVLAQFSPEAFPSDLRAQWRRLIDMRLRLARHFRARYLNIAIPEKLSVYEDRLAGLSVDPRLSPARRLNRALRFSPARRGHLDLVGPFRAERERKQLYLKTDTHWTFRGCDVAFRAICRRLGARPCAALDDPRHRRTDRCTGDLGNKLDPQQAEAAEVWAYPRRAERFHADDRVLALEAEGQFFWGGGSGCHVAYRNTSPGVDRRRVLLVGDSYSNHAWQPHAGALTPILAETFSEVHFIWSSGIDWDYVEQIRPDIVITEIAERFLVKPRFLAIELTAIREAMTRLGIG